MTQAPRSGRNSPQRGQGGSRTPRGQASDGKSAGSSGGKDFGASRGKAFGATGNKSAGAAGRKATGKKPNPGPAAFGRERFGKNLGPVRRSTPGDTGPKQGTSGQGRAGAGRPRSPIADHAHDPAGVRLQKVLAGAGVASRRVCEDMIAAGRVEVDGRITTELGVRVDPSTAVIHVDGLRIQLNETLSYLVFNKPRGVVCTMEDPEGRSCIGDFVRNRGERLFHVGRLDAATEGLLLLTNDGELANRLTHPSYEVSKTYLVQVRGPMAHGVGAQMRAGIALDDGVAHVDSFKLVDSTPGHILVEVVLHSGRNRIVRRLFDAVGHPVVRLVRTQMGPIRLNDQRQGSIRALGNQEVGHLLAAVGM